MLYGLIDKETTLIKLEIINCKYREFKLMLMLIHIKDLDKGTSFTLELKGKDLKIFSKEWKIPMVF